MRTVRKLVAEVTRLREERERYRRELAAANQLILQLGGQVREMRATLERTGRESTSDYH